MKKSLLIAALALASVQGFAAETLTTGQTVNLTQGTDYVIDGIKGYYISPDYFVAQADGSYKFNAVSGQYKVNVNDGLRYAEVLAMNGDATATIADGAIWIIGSANVGLPTYGTNGVNWTTERGISLAQVAPKKYQFTAVVGQQIATTINFKFFGQRNWGTEFKGNAADYHYATTSPYLSIGPADSHDDGNIFCANGTSFAEGDTVVFKADFTEGYDKGVLDVEIHEMSVPTFNGVEMTELSQTRYAYFGEFEQGKSYTVGGNDALNSDDWYIDNDYFKRNDDGSLTFKAIDGSYRVEANFIMKAFHIYPLNADGNAATYDDGFAMYANGGDGFGKPSFTQNPNAWGSSNGWNPTLNLSVSMAQVKEKVYTLTLTVGKQLRSGTTGNESFKFYGAGEGWAGELSVGAYEFENEDVFRINTGSGDTGNIFQTEALNDGDTYVLILDRTGEMPVVSVVKAEDVAGLTTGIQNPITTATKTAVGAYYTLSGVRMAQPTKAGLYIHEGKKIVIK